VPTSARSLVAKIPTVTVPASGSHETRRWREPDSNPQSHPTLVAAHIRPIIVPTPRRSSAAALADGFVPLDSDRRHSRIRLHRSRTLVFPSRFAQRDPHSQVGPGVRIRFPPAASQERTGPPRCEDGGFSPVTLRCSTREIVNAPSARAVASSRPCAIAAWAWRIAAAAQMGEAGVPRWRRKAACRRPRRSGRRSARPRCCHGSAASSVQSELDCRLLVLEASPDEAPPEDLRKFVEPLACDLLVVR
jgi:hypothetical protein